MVAGFKQAEPKTKIEDLCAVQHTLRKIKIFSSLRLTFVLSSNEFKKSLFIWFVRTYPKQKFIACSQFADDVRYKARDGTDLRRLLLHHRRPVRDAGD